MIKKLIKLANHLDAKGLVKEADYLDGIIKESKSNFDKLDKLWGWIKGLGKPSECSRLTAAVMVSQAETPERRSAMPGCAEKDYEYSDAADKVEILKALADLKRRGSAYDVDGAIRNYMDEIVKRGLLDGEMISGDKEFFETFLSNSWAGKISAPVKELIAVGVNAGSGAINKKINQIDRNMEAAKKFKPINQRGA